MRRTVIGALFVASINNSVALAAPRVACHNRAVAYQNVNLVAVPQNFVVTQFAVPVGVPVAQQSYISYGSTVGYGSPVQSGTVAAPMGMVSNGCRCQQQSGSCQAGGCNVAPPAPQPNPNQNPQPIPIPTPNPQPVPNPPVNPGASLLTQNCSRCHTGDTAKAGFRVDVPLTCEQKLTSISRLLDDDETKRMPKGVALDPATLGKLIQELSK